MKIRIPKIQKKLHTSFTLVNYLLYFQKWQLGTVFIPDSLGYLLGTNCFGLLALRLGRWRVAMAAMILVGVSTFLVSAWQKDETSFCSFLNPNQNLLIQKKYYYILKINWILGQNASSLSLNIVNVSQHVKRQYLRFYSNVQLKFL